MKIQVKFTVKHYYGKNSNISIHEPDLINQVHWGKVHDIPPLGQPIHIVTKQAENFSIQFLLAKKLDIIKTNIFAKFGVNSKKEAKFINNK